MIFLYKNDTLGSVLGFIFRFLLPNTITAHNGKGMDVYESFDSFPKQSLLSETVIAAVKLRSELLSLFAANARLRRFGCFDIFPPPSSSSSDGLRSTQYAVGHTFSTKFPRISASPNSTFVDSPVRRPPSRKQRHKTFVAFNRRERDRLPVLFSSAPPCIRNNLCCGSSLASLPQSLFLSYLSNISPPFPFIRRVRTAESSPSGFLGKNRLACMRTFRTLYATTVRNGTRNITRMDRAKPVFSWSDLRAGSGRTEAITKSRRGESRPSSQTNRCDFREDVLVTFVVSRTTLSAANEDSPIFGRHTDDVRIRTSVC